MRWVHDARRVSRCRCIPLARAARRPPLHSSQNQTRHPSVSRHMFARNLVIPTPHATRWHAFDLSWRLTRRVSRLSAYPIATRVIPAPHATGFERILFIPAPYATQWHAIDSSQRHMRRVSRMPCSVTGVSLLPRTLGAEDEWGNPATRTRAASTQVQPNAEPGPMNLHQQGDPPLERSRD